MISSMKRMEYIISALPQSLLRSLLVDISDKQDRIYVVQNQMSDNWWVPFLINSDGAFFLINSRVYGRTSNLPTCIIQIFVL
jgi:hypothetical protein